MYHHGSFNFSSRLQGGEMPPVNSADTDAPSSATKPRRYQKALRIYCTAEECAAIEDRARKAGLSVSEYARRVCMGYQPSSVIDYEEAEKLLHLGADLGRMGGLLKWWLSGTAPVMKTAWGSQVFIGEKELRALLANMEKTQRMLREQITSLMAKKPIDEGAG